MASKEPWLNPLLRPHEWERVSHFRRFRWLVLLLLVSGLLAMAGGYYLRPVDLTDGLAPAAIAEAAGLAMMRSEQYRFEVDITGQSRVDPFPQTHMKGTYQRTPQLLHLTGEVLSVESKVGLEYYLEERDLFLKDPRTKRWLLLRGAYVAELLSFQPDQLAAPLVSGVRSARMIGRESLPDGETLVIDLEMDPKMMLPQLTSLQGDRAEYRLWVYTRTLRPARFLIDVAAPPEADEDRTVLWFTYQIDWDFSQFDPVRVPKQVRDWAVDIGSDAGPMPELIPGN